MSGNVNNARGWRWDGHNTRLGAYVNGIEALRLDVPGASSGVDFRFFGSTTDNYITWDSSANDMKFEDSTSIMFGTGAGAGPGNAGDVEMRWDGTDFDILAATNNAIIKFGNGTNSFDVWLYGSAAANYVVWDASANDLIFQDNCSIMLGTGTDVEIRWDSTDLDVLAAADDSVINFGNGTASFDIKTFGNTTALFTTWDASASALIFEDATKLQFGTGTDVSINWDGTDLEIAAAADDAVINFGNGTQSFDIKTFGNTTALFTTWDASASSLIFEDATALKFGTGTDVSINWDGTDLEIAAAADDAVINFGNGTLSFDIKTFGNTTADYMLWDASANNLDLLGAADLRIANIGTLDFPAQAAGTATFTVTGLTSADLVIISPRETTVGVLAVDKVEASKLTIRNSASETANVECNFYMLQKAS